MRGETTTEPGTSTPRHGICPATRGTILRGGTGRLHPERPLTSACRTGRGSSPRRQRGRRGGEGNLVRYARGQAFEEFERVGGFLSEFRHVGDGRVIGKGPDDRVAVQAPARRGHLGGPADWTTLKVAGCVPSQVARPRVGGSCSRWSKPLDSTRGCGSFRASSVLSRLRARPARLGEREGYLGKRERR